MRVWQSWPDLMFGHDSVLWMLEASVRTTHHHYTMARRSCGTLRYADLWLANWGDYPTW